MLEQPALLLHQREDIVPIPGTKRVAYVEENAKASNIKLSTEELQQLAQIAPLGAASGERYAPERMDWLDR